MIFRLRIPALALGALAIAAPLAAQQPITLQAAITMAESHSAAARANTSTRESARDQHRAFIDGYMPALSLSGFAPNYSRSITPVVQPDGTTLYLPVAQTDAQLTANLSQRIPWTNTTLVLSSGLSQVHVSGPAGFRSWSSSPFIVGITQPLFRSNAQAWDIRQQNLSLESSERRYLESREDVAISATGAYFDVYSAEANLDNAKNEAAVNDTLYSLNKERFQIGKIGENDLLQSELALLRARSSLTEAQLGYDRAVAQFRLTVGLPPAAPIVLSVTAEVPDFDPDTALAVRWARDNSSTVNDARVAEVQADRQLSQARWDNGPGATVSASYGYNATADNAADAYRGLLNAQTFMLQVNMPLWQWGAHSSTVDAAEANRDAVRTTETQSLAQLDLDAHFAALQLSQARRDLAIAVKADTVANQRFEVAYNRYVIGRITIDNLYIAQSEKDAALQAYGQALRTYWTAYYQLRRITLYDFERKTPIRELDAPGSAPTLAP